ncbi:MAG: hypothetical protein FWC98_02875 [Bacteroidales bacterium]|nr:hypothetical protein [Bacteroidales bacterium]
MKQYIDAFFSDKKPSNWEEICREKSEIMETSEVNSILFTYQKYLLLEVRKLHRTLTLQGEDKLEEMDLRQTLKEIEAIEKRNESEKYTYEKFSLWKLAVSKFLGYNIDESKISLFDFLIATKQLSEYNKKIQADYQKNARQRRHS